MKDNIKKELIKQRMKIFFKISPIYLLISFVAIICILVTAVAVLFVEFL